MVGGSGGQEGRLGAEARGAVPGVPLAERSALPAVAHVSRWCAAGGVSVLLQSRNDPGEYA